MVEDKEKSLALLMILNENITHVSGQKVYYDDLMHVTFDGQSNCNGKKDGNASFHYYQKWKDKYSNRMMKYVYNEVIDYVVDDSKICEVKELCSLPKELKREQIAALVERIAYNKKKKQLDREAKMMIKYDGVEVVFYWKIYRN